MITSVACSMRGSVASLTRTSRTPCHLRAPRARRAPLEATSRSGTSYLAYASNESLHPTATREGRPCTVASRSTAQPWSLPAGRPLRRQALRLAAATGC